MENISRPKLEIEGIVTMIRLNLYNHSLPCGPIEIRRKMRDSAVEPRPSVRTISRILARQGLTHQRTGWYFDKDLNEVGETGNFNCR
jgi:hypothetical protein